MSLRPTLNLPLPSASLPSAKEVEMIRRMNSSKPAGVAKAALQIQENHFSALAACESKFSLGRKDASNEAETRVKFLLSVHNELARLEMGNGTLTSSVGIYGSPGYGSFALQTLEDSLAGCNKELYGSKLAKLVTKRLTGMYKKIDTLVEQGILTFEQADDRRVRLRELIELQTGRSYPPLAQ